MTQKEPHRRGMVVIAHADDAEYGCAGTVAKWCREGMEVVYVVITDGSKGSSDLEVTPERLVETRRQEQIAASVVLGVKHVVFLGYEDSMLEPTLALRRDIAREIRKHKPDILISPNPARRLQGGSYLGHPDHMAAGEATVAAVFPAARDRMTFPELLQEGLEPHKVREVLIMDQADPDVWVDISDTIEVAIEALAQHASQMSEAPEDLDMVWEWKRRAGEQSGMKYAEAFKQFHLD